MSFQYATGTAANIAAWFTAFEAMITAAGWTIVSRVNPTDIIISSSGEDGDFTMLFARVWENANTVTSELRDDAAGTHVTTRGGALNTGAGPFDYWMNCDADWINIGTLHPAPDWSYRGFGCVWSCALDLIDETQQMVILSQIYHIGVIATVLRNALGGWDTDFLTYQCQWAETFTAHPVDGSFAFTDIFAAPGQTIYGEIPQVTGRVSPTIANYAVHNTTEAGNTTSWIALQDDRPGGTNRYMMRTGGSLSVGADVGEFLYETGTADLPVDLFDTIIPAFMASIGWTDEGNPGFHTYAHLFSSTGESGTDDLYVIISWLDGANDFAYIYVQDDLAGTHRTTFVSNLLEYNSFPMTYHLVGDRDCVMLLTEHQGYFCSSLWGGKVQPAHPNIDCTYHMMTSDSYVGTHRHLRDRDGNWNQLFAPLSDGAAAANSSPSSIDWRTCLVWPYWAMENLGGGAYDMIGQMKYLHYIGNPGYITAGDEIRIEDRVYKVFYNIPYDWFAIRIL
jgi:hypothetical protein